MKIAVFSDSHGFSRPMLDAVADNAPDAVLFCGDGLRDLAALTMAYPAIPIQAVAGNCDYAPSLPLTMTVEYFGVKILVTHGHGYGVKSGSLDRLAYAAQEVGAKVALYGHTHLARRDALGGVTLINPGSIRSGSYCVLEISPAGEIRWSFEKV